MNKYLGAIETYLVPPLARIYRKALTGTCFVAVTGSCGKTTTKELIADILQHAAETHRSFDSNNRFFSVARTVLELRRRHRYCVVEVGASGPDSIGRSAELLAPDIAVVTAIGSDHYKAFRGAEAAAREKARLVAKLDEHGIAVLNMDDPLSLGMAEHCQGNVMSYGLNQMADVRGEITGWRWPERLTMKVTFDRQQTVVNTQLLGRHLATSVLAALTVAVACGMTLKKAAAAISESPPFFGRMSSTTIPGDVTFIHDGFKAPMWTMESIIEYLSAARAKRRILVVGTISDYGGSSGGKYRRLARLALQHIEKVVFATPYAESYLRKVRDQFPDRMHVFPDTRSASLFVNDLLRPGDLVLLKGSLRADHLERIAMQANSAIRCWRTNCGRETFCKDCELRDSPEVIDERAGTPAVVT